ncbi:GmrSD restriction endonuclease domain-containing protein [Deinococcus radiophilus]|uniref:GmrSD restriction endonuclease domain-containing protein n=1 Tax=Deinococcus radiophilus TaxID=32062 RepID=UPI003623059A
MSDITPIYKTISELLSNQTFSIDDYQREYKWDEKNIQELLRDLQGKFESSYREGDQTSEVPSTTATTLVPSF